MTDLEAAISRLEQAAAVWFNQDLHRDLQALIAAARAKTIESSRLISSIDLKSGVARLCDGQRVPITRYFGSPDEAPDEGADVTSFDWVRSVVCGPTANGDWLVVEVSAEDREDAR